ncbi:MAG: MFS transporter, partial [Moorella sp. (in: Bacteria)]|nr:MFS transporter [Moorella sp. (in: firmicutes)]
LGLNTASVYVGLSLGPILGGFLTQHLGWPAIFFLTAFPGLLAVLAVTRGKEEPPRARGKSLTRSIAPREGR